MNRGLDAYMHPILPSYESVMNTFDWTTSLEEVGKPIDIDSTIRILKPQYDKKKSLSITQERQGFMGESSKKVHICSNCKKKGHSIENCWAKGGGKEGQGPKQKKRSKSRKKKGKEKANAATESSSDGKSDESIAFINSDCVTFIKDSIGATVIIDTGASMHMTPHQGLLKNYQSLPSQKLLEKPIKEHSIHLGSGTSSLLHR